MNTSEIFKETDEYKNSIKTICKFLNNKIDKKLTTETDKIKNIVTQIIEKYKNKEYITLYNLVNELLDEILNYKDIINELIYLYNNYYIVELDKHNVKKTKNIWDKFTLFNDVSALKNIEGNKFILAKNILQNKNNLSEIFKNIKCSNDFKKSFTNVIKHFINNLIDTCSKCSCDEYKNISNLVNDKIKEITVGIIDTYIYELKCD